MEINIDICSLQTLHLYIYVHPKRIKKPYSVRLHVYAEVFIYQRTEKES